MKKYNVQVKHAITDEWTNIFWHLSNKLSAHDMFYPLCKTGLPCRVVQESHPEDIIIEIANLSIGEAIDKLTTGIPVGLFDDTGREIHKGDTVEVQNTLETKTSYRSEVYFGPDGAQIDGHPALKSLGLDYRRKLSEFCDYGIGDEQMMAYISCKIID